LDFGAHSTYYQASKEGRVINGKFVPLSEAYPKFKTEELDRCIRIPIHEEPGPELDEILQLLAANPHIYLDTGHVAAEEAIRLVNLKGRYGYNKIVVSSSVTKIAKMEQLKSMVNQGAFIEMSLGSYTAAQMIPLTHYYVEKEYASIDEGMSSTRGIREVVDIIESLGADHCILSTDFGRYALSSPVEGLRQFIACALDLGIPPEDVRKMVKTNPEQLLGLET
jgi:hypothetical protein